MLIVQLMSIVSKVTLDDFLSLYIILYLCLFISVPDKAPKDLNVLSMQYPDGTTVIWSAIPNENWRGLLLGYRIAYRIFEQGEVPQFNRGWNFINTSSLNTSIVIKGLQVHARYSLKIAGYTKIGAGPFSNEVEFCKLFTCYWYLLCKSFFS